MVQKGTQLDLNCCFLIHFEIIDWYKVNTKSYKANKGLRLIDLIPALSVYFGSELSFGNIYPYGEPFSHQSLILKHPNLSKTIFLVN